MKKAVAVISGGLDSAVMLYKLRADDYIVKAISFDYGQRHVAELSYAGEIARGFGLTHEIVNLSGVSKLLNSSITNRLGDIPEGHYKDESMTSTIVPNRNAIMLSIAFGWAASLNAGAVVSGIQGSADSIYPDCRQPFLSAFWKMEYQSLLGYGTIDLLTPLANMSKVDVVKLGAKLAVPFEKTYSCYNGGVLHCGRCGACSKRIEAFKLANILDPTEYASI